MNVPQAKSKQSSVQSTLSTKKKGLLFEISDQSGSRLKGYLRMADQDQRKVTTLENPRHPTEGEGALSPATFCFFECVWQ